MLTSAGKVRRGGTNKAPPRLSIGRHTCISFKTKLANVLFVGLASNRSSEHCDHHPQKSNITKHCSEETREKLAELSVVAPHILTRFVGLKSVACEL